MNQRSSSVSRTDRRPLLVVGALVGAVLLITLLFSYNVTILVGALALFGLAVLALFRSPERDAPPEDTDVHQNVELSPDAGMKRRVHED